MNGALKVDPSGRFVVDQNEKNYDTSQKKIQKKVRCCCQATTLRYGVWSWMDSKIRVVRQGSSENTKTLHLEKLFNLQAKLPYLYVYESSTKTLVLSL